MTRQCSCGTDGWRVEELSTIAWHEGHRREACVLVCSDCSDLACAGYGGVRGDTSAATFSHWLRRNAWHCMRTRRTSDGWSVSADMSLGWM
jgi:hypothetical protein